MRKSFYIILIILFALGCKNNADTNKEVKKDEKTVAGKNENVDVSETKNSNDNLTTDDYKEEFNVTYDIKEAFRESYLKTVEENEEILNKKIFYKAISDELTEREKIKYNVLGKVYNLKISVGDTLITENNETLPGNYEINISYNDVYDDLKHEYKEYFGENLPMMNLEQMLKINTNREYKLIYGDIYYNMSSYLIFEELQSGDEISIEMNDDFKNIAGFDFDTIKIKVK